MATQLSLRPREAARALGVSERWLWEQTKAGEIPRIKLPKGVVYRVASLEAWLKSRESYMGDGAA